MKKIKKIVFCLMCVIISLFFLGCSKVTLSTTLNANGKISTSLEVNLQDVPSHRATIYNIFREYYSQLDRKYEDNLIYYFSFVYDLEAFSSSDRNSKISHILMNNTQYLAGDTSDLSRLDADGYKYFYVSKDFASIYAYLMYFNPSVFVYDSQNNKITLSQEYHSLIDVPMASKDGNIEKSGNIFINKYVQDFCPLYYNNEEPKFLYDATISSINISQGDTLSGVIKNICGLTDDEVEYYFSFTTPYKRLHSSAQTGMSSSGYTHNWKLGGVDATVEVWRNYANYVTWYIVAIALGAVTIFISILFIKTKNKKKKLKGLELLEKIHDLEESKK